MMRDYTRRKGKAIGVSITGRPGAMAFMEDHSDSLLLSPDSYFPTLQFSFVTAFLTAPSRGSQHAAVSVLGCFTVAARIIVLPVRGAPALPTSSAPR